MVWCNVKTEQYSVVWPNVTIAILSLSCRSWLIMPVFCSSCEQKRAVLKRPKTGHSLCKECFFWAFEEEVHHTIISARLFNRGETVGIGASGGKDSTVLAHVMKVLNERYDYGLNLLLLSVDEGITGYRDDSLETVKRNQQQYDLPLKIVSYDELYGWTMDAIVRQVGLKNNCTFCGVFRRQALDRGAMMLKVDKICTGMRPYVPSLACHVMFVLAKP